MVSMSYELHRRWLLALTLFLLAAGFITVGGVVTHPAADSKPDMSVSPHPASRSIGC